MFETVFFENFAQVLYKWRLNNLQITVLKSKTSEVTTSIDKLLINPFFLLGLLSSFVISVFLLVTMLNIKMVFDYSIFRLVSVLVFLIGITLGDLFTIGKLLGLLVFMVTLRF